MDALTLTLIAIGLAMDAFAVSVASGIAMKNLRVRHALTVAVFFGSFQALMPLLGWLAGISARDLISGVDHWIAFGLLAFIGGKMIYEALRLEEAEQPRDVLNLFVLVILSVATSIDALAVGLTFAFLKIAIATPALVIGAIAFLLSFAGVYLGNKSGHFFESKIEILGGLILIGIGTKILIDHLTA